MNKLLLIQICYFDFVKVRGIIFIYSDERREKEYMFLVRPCVFVDVGDVGVDDFSSSQIYYTLCIVVRFSAWAQWQGPYFYARTHYIVKRNHYILLVAGGPRLRSLAVVMIRPRLKDTGDISMGEFPIPAAQGHWRHIYGRVSKSCIKLPRSLAAQAGSTYDATALTRLLG